MHVFSPKNFYKFDKSGKEDSAARDHKDHVEDRVCVNKEAKSANHADLITAVFFLDKLRVDDKNGADKSNDPDKYFKRGFWKLGKEIFE